MRRTVLGLSGGALPVAAGISVFTVLAGTLAVVDWAVVSPVAPRGDLHLAPLPAAQPAGSALDDPVRAVARAARRAAVADEPAAPARRVRVLVATRPAAARLLPRPAPRRPAPVVITPPAPRPAPPTGPSAPVPAPASAAAEPRAGAPLAGVGTIAAVAAENTTEALGTVAGDVAEGAARALPVLRQPLTRVGTLVRGTLTSAGRLVGGLLRGVTGAPPRASNTAAHPQPAP